MRQRLCCVVFSFDRPMQADALLASIRRHATRVYDEIIVLFRASNRRFAEGYERVRDEHSDVRWSEEVDFRDDVLDAVDPEGLIVFHTDDDLFFADVDPFELRDDETTFSVRLGLNIRYSYPFDLPDRLEDPVVERRRISWEWRTQPVGSFSYPFALNGHVLRAGDVRPLIESIQFTDPNELESGLHAMRDRARPRIASFLTSRVVTVPANVVTRSIRNRHGTLYTPYELNERYLGGERIDAETMSFNAVTACHQEIPFAFRRIDARPGEAAP